MYHFQSNYGTHLLHSPFFPIPFHWLEADEMNTVTLATACKRSWVPDLRPAGEQPTLVMPTLDFTSVRSEILLCLIRYLVLGSFVTAVSVTLTNMLPISNLEKSQHIL